MRTVTGVEFRTMDEEPFEEGFYYARQHGQENIQVVEILEHHRGGYVVFTCGSGLDAPTEMFDWFGPVREVRESSIS